MFLRLIILFVISSLSLVSVAVESNAGYLHVPVKTDSGLIRLSLLSEDQAQLLFQQLSAKKYIPFNYVLDGCYARAHEMSFLMEKQGIQSGKIFIAGPLKAWDRFRPGWWVEWKGYHVAPIIAVGNVNKVVIKVIDPSVAYRLLTIDEWLSLISINGATQRPFLAERYMYRLDSKKDNHRWLPQDLKNTQETLNYYRKQLVKQK